MSTIKKPQDENDFIKREQDLLTKEAALRQRSIELDAKDVEVHKALWDLKEEKLTYHSIRNELI